MYEVREDFFSYPGKLQKVKEGPSVANLQRECAPKTMSWEGREEYRAVQTTTTKDQWDSMKGEEQGEGQAGSGLVDKQKWTQRITLLWKYNQ